MTLEKLRRVWLNFGAAVEVYFIWAAMLVFVLGVALAEAWRPPLPTDWLLFSFPAAAALALLAWFRRRLFWLLPVFFVCGFALEPLGPGASLQLCRRAGRGGDVCRARGRGYG